MKLDRHRKIVDLIQEFEIETQEELARRLHAAGYAVTQSTISRDIRELNLKKAVNRQGKLVYVSEKIRDGEASERYARILKGAFVSMDAAQNILVVRTVPGMAMAAAAVLDELDWEEVLGCIAGDDTIMCVVRSERHCRTVMERLRSVLDGMEA
ncbi:MAG: arginine repressor [Lachnospiraceae bacterium]|nr:arginine repressor [Lachnospiraceae bacterium]MCI9545222.1 arginine repressor [Lachnospiraceae bacterium]